MFYVNYFSKECEFISFPIKDLATYNALNPAKSLDESRYTPLQEQNIMRILFTNSRLNIKTGTTVSGISSQAETLKVVSGRVWVTIEGCKDDYWLAAGETLVVEAGKLVVIEAFREDSEIHLPHLQHESEVRRAFDFFNALPRHPWKTSITGEAEEATNLNAITMAGQVQAAQPQFGYTGDLCLQSTKLPIQTCSA